MLWSQHAAWKMAHGCFPDMIHRKKYLFMLFHKWIIAPLKPSMWDIPCPHYHSCIILWFYLDVFWKKRIPMQIDGLHFSSRRKENMKVHWTVVFWKVSIVLQPELRSLSFSSVKLEFIVFYHILDHQMYIIHWHKVIFINFHFMVIICYWKPGSGFRKRF